MCGMASAMAARSASAMSGASGLKIAAFGLVNAVAVLVSARVCGGPRRAWLAPVRHDRAMTYATGASEVRVTGRRVVATIIDGLIFGLINGALVSAFGVEGTDSGFGLTSFNNTGTVWLSVIVLLYYTLFEGLTGLTIGKWVTGIRVIDAGSGGRPGLLSGFVRTLLRLIDGFLGYLVGFLIVINSDRRRRLGDMAAKTLVVRSR
ncbi:RDD family protein [Paractinoplanes aksuensis]|nr:RDD family protein [Actinoplanes aksuensis]